MLNSSNLQAKLSGIYLSQVLGARALFSNLMFELQTGEILLVRGANGCGKTSLLRIICGLALPESGTVFWDNKNIHEQPSEYRTILTYVGHRAGVKLDLTPEENLQLVAVNQAQESHLSIETTLDQLGLRSPWVDYGLAEPCCGYWTNRLPPSMTRVSLTWKSCSRHTPGKAAW